MTLYLRVAHGKIIPSSSNITSKLDCSALKTSLKFLSTLTKRNYLIRNRLQIFLLLLTHFTTMFNFYIISIFEITAKSPWKVLMFLLTLNIFYKLF